MKQRLDTLMVQRQLVQTRSQAESYIKLGYVSVDGIKVTKAGTLVGPESGIQLSVGEQYVSRAGLKLASVAEQFRLDFRDKVVLDVGSSTGGFTQFALTHGAQKVVAIDVGTDQLHPSLRSDPRIDLREQTDIRDVLSLDPPPDIVVIDVSFISLRQILPAVYRLAASSSIVVAMCKPQFEVGPNAKHKGVIKNDTIRRAILADFEAWLKSHWSIKQKADSGVSGAKGNKERFYLLAKASRH